MLKNKHLLLSKKSIIWQLTTKYFWLKLKILNYSVLTLFFINIIFHEQAFSQTSPYTFTLNTAATTSAGVFTNDSVLIRTLWSVVKFQAGTHPLIWDGKDDAGNIMPNGNYTIKVTSNNVNYAWEGVIGNTSTSQTGSSVHRGFYFFMATMTFTKNHGYYSFGYSEARPSINKFLTSKPQEKINIVNKDITTGDMEIVVNDGNYIYWAGYDAFHVNNSFVFATKVSDDSDVKFANGFNYNPGSKAYNMIGYLNETNSIITGLAVQKAGNYLFIARKGLNNLYVVNKTTGALVQTIPINSPGALCVDGSDNLWMISDINTVSKYKVNSDGTLTNAIVTLDKNSSVAPIKPMAVAVSPDNNTVTICDTDPSSQQVKAYNNKDATYLWSLGDEGGYFYSPTVNNHKFHFNFLGQGEATRYLPFIVYQPDGTFWVNDPGNFRVMHYDAARNYIENIMSLGPSYSTWADRNDRSRVGVGYLEFQVDNAQRISGSNGWQLKKNWGAVIPSTYDSFQQFKFVNTFTHNGVSKTFGYLRRSGDNRYMYELVEFPPADQPLRLTGIILEESVIDQHGDLITRDINPDGHFITKNLKKYAFLGFDSSNNPIWSKIPEYIFDASTLPNTGPFPLEILRNDVLTSNDKVIFYNYSATEGYHLGAIKKGGNKWLWETAKATNKTYKGPFPDPSYFDIGNGVIYAGSCHMILDANIYTGYHGEAWKQGQTNKFNHYIDNGLAIGQFGLAVGDYVNEEAVAMMAGNALTPQVVRGESSDVNYIWSGDESYHAGYHKWKISGLNTINTQDITIVYPFPVIPNAIAGINPISGKNLMEGLTSNSVVQNNLYGWHRSQSEDYTNQFSKYWSVMTSVRAYDKVDVYMQYRQDNSSYNVTRDLGNNVGLSSWTLSGKLNLEGNYGNAQNGQGGSYIEILDKDGKVISRFYNVETYTTDYDHNIVIHGNDQIIATNTRDNMKIITSATQPFELSYSDGKLNFKYAGYTIANTTRTQDNGADPTKPTTFRVYFWTSGANYDRIIDLQDLIFYNNIDRKIDQTIKFNIIPNQAFRPTSAPIILSATSTSNLPIIYTIISGPAKILGNSITVTGVGDVVVKAEQTGNEIYNAANPITQSFIVIARDAL